MKLKNLHNIAERTARVVPVVGGIAVMTLIFYWQYQYKAAKLAAEVNQWCSQQSFPEWGPLNVEPPTSECAMPDTLAEVWLPAFLRTLALTGVAAFMLAIVGLGLYAAFASPIQHNNRRSFMESDTVRANLAPLISVLGTAVLAATMVTILANLSFVC